MQSSNSIWKMTALAGVVGLGLLGILQFQQTMDRKPSKTADTKVRLEDFKPLSELDNLDTQTAETDAPAGNSDPRRRSSATRKFDAFNDSNDEDLSVGKLPTKRSRAEIIGDQLGEDFSGDQIEPEPKKKVARPRVALSLEEPIDGLNNETREMTADESRPADLPVFEEEPLPKPYPQKKDSAKLQAQQLVQAGRKLIDDGRLEDARLKAAEAAELPATFGRLEDTPEAVLADIERLIADQRLTMASRRPVQLTGGADNDKDSDADRDEPAFADAPLKKSAPATKPARKSQLEDDEDLFADNPPKSINGKKQEPDPPIPPAEEESLELPAFPDESGPPQTRLRTDESNANVPSRLKPLAAAPLDPDEQISGDGTVHANAPRGPQRPELKIEKVAPANATLGQPMVYTIVIRNVGESAAHTVVVEDQIPKGTSLSGTIPRAELTNKKLVWRLGTIKPGEQKEISVKVVPVTEGQIGSVATVNFQAEIASRTTVASPKLSLKLTIPPQIRMGETAMLNFQLTNNGTVDAQHVVLRNLIPENVKARDAAERDLEFDVGTLAAGKSQTVQLPLAAIRPGKGTSKATLTTDGAAAAETQVDINVLGQLVGLTRHGQTNWYVGRPIEFENRLTNNSLSAATNTVIVESLPGAVEFVSASNGGRFDARQRTVTWQVPHLDPQQNLPLKIKLIPKTIGSHAGSVQITESGHKGANVDYQFRTIGAAVLAVEFGEKSEAYSMGEQFSVRMQVRNKGSGAATKVLVRISIPAEVQFVSARGPIGHTINGREIIFEPIAEIGGQGNVAFDLTFKALGAGDSKLQVEMQSDQFKKPLTHEEPLVIFGN